MGRSEEICYQSPTMLNHSRMLERPYRKLCNLTTIVLTVVATVTMIALVGYILHVERQGDLCEYINNRTSLKGGSSQAQISWIKADHGSVPEGALIAGYEWPNHYTYIMRTKHNDGSTVVGKVVGAGNSKSGYYTFGGKKHTLTSYEVLVAPVQAVRWQIVIAGNIPKHAVVPGIFGGEPSYICRIAVDKHVVNGRALKSVGKCFVELTLPGVGGPEHSSEIYEVLVDSSLE